MQWHDVQSAFVGGFQPDLRGAAFVVGLEKPCGTEAPLVSGLQSWKAESRVWSAEIISDIFRERQEFSRHQGADRVAATILGTRVAMTISKKTGHGII